MHCLGVSAGGQDHTNIVANLKSQFPDMAMKLVETHELVEAPCICILNWSQSRSCSIALCQVAVLHPNALDLYVIPICQCARCRVSRYVCQRALYKVLPHTEPIEYHREICLISGIRTRSRGPDHNLLKPFLRTQPKG